MAKIPPIRTPTRIPTKTTQTTHYHGRKVRITTTTSSAGTKVTMTDAPLEEWILQAAAVAALKSLPEYAGDAERVAENDNAGRPSFTLAADMNAARRSPKENLVATATGIAAGDPDLRVYLPNGALKMIEYKNAEGVLTKSQRIRHPLLASLGHPVVTLRVASKEDAAKQTVELVEGWLAA